MAAPAEVTLPTLVVTGFLGAGKTTAINALIAARSELRVAVIENEAGEVCVDAELLRGAARVVEVTGGCACCALRGSLVAALEHLHERRSEFDALVVETSGIADPLAILQALQSPSARATFDLAGLLCVVDAVGVAAADLLDQLWTRQVRLAGAVLLTKLEHIDESQVPAVQRRVREVNEQAAFIDAAALPGLLDRKLAGGEVLDEQPDDVDDHGFGAVALSCRRPLDLDAVDRWLREILYDPSGTVLRVKGTLAVADHRHSYVVQATRELLETYPAPRRPRTQLVIIGRGIDRAVLQAGLERCAALESQAAR